MTVAKNAQLRYNGRECHGERCQARLIVAAVRHYIC